MEEMGVQDLDVGPRGGGQKGREQLPWQEQQGEGREVGEGVGKAAKEERAAQASLTRSWRGGWC